MSSKNIPFMLADIGEGIAEVEILQWFVKPGDHVAQFDPICEVQSDKATTPISSRFDGKITSIEYEVGDLAQVGTPLVHIEVTATPEEAAASVAAAAPPATPAAAPASSPSSSGTKDIPFLLADIGEGIAEVEILQWFVKPGDHVAQFDPICEVQSDKATTPISSRFDGKITSIEYEVGALAQVGTPLVHIEVAATDEEVAAAAAAPAAAAATATSSSGSPTGSPAGPRGKVLTSPAVRHLSKEHNIDLTLVTPTGPNGRILKGDVLKFMKEGPKTRAQPAAAAAAPVSTPAARSATPAAPAAPAAPAVSAPKLEYSLEDREQKIAGLQRIMVQTMTKANEVPTLLYCDDIVMDELMKVRATLKPLAQEQGVKLSFLPFIIKATSLALKKHPRMNSIVNDDCTAVTLKGSHNIAVAMDTPRGLLVPNIKNVQDRSVFEIAAELNRLQGLGAAGKLGQDDLSGGTFTLSNIGTLSVVFFCSVFLHF